MEVYSLGADELNCACLAISQSVLLLLVCLQTLTCAGSHLGFIVVCSGKRMREENESDVYQ